MATSENIRKDTSSNNCTQAVNFTGTVKFTNQIFAASTELTIATGAITVTQSNHTVDGEGDADDTLVTINGMVNGQTYYIKPENTAREITIDSGGGNLLTPSGKDWKIPHNTVVQIYYDGTNGIIMNLQGFERRVVVKESDQSLQSQTTLQQDSDLQFSGLPANTYWKLTAFIYFTSPSTADYKFQFNLNVGAGAMVTTYNDTSDVVTHASLSFDTTYEISYGQYFQVTGVLSTGGSDTTLNYEFAQVNSVASDTTNKTGSWILLERIA